MNKMLPVVTARGEEENQSYYRRRKRAEKEEKSEQTRKRDKIVGIFINASSWKVG
jgi:hypothetical protein